MENKPLLEIVGKTLRAEIPRSALDTLSPDELVSIAVCVMIVYRMLPAETGVLTLGGVNIVVDSGTVIDATIRAHIPHAYVTQKQTTNPLPQQQTNAIH